MKVYIETLGCPKNFNDSQVMCGILQKEGHTLTEDKVDANVIIVNTCGFINDAKIESIEKIFDMSKEDKLLIVSGCLTQRFGDELYEQIPEINGIIGVNDYDKLPQILSDLEKESKRIKIINQYQAEEQMAEQKLDQSLWKNRQLDQGAKTATIKISEGCDNRCSYCVIPSIRGPFRSRKSQSILDEARHLASLGIKELVVIAQDSTNYGADLGTKEEINTLAKLLKEICLIDGISWIRLMYCYEDKITDELIEVIATEEKICNYLDLPLQHISDNVLSAMKRKSTAKSIKGTIGKLRARIPDIHIRTTFIVGFPGETEEDFLELAEFVPEIKFDRLGVFCYSREEGTPAHDMEGQIEQNIKEGRRESIMLEQIEISRQKNIDKIGQKLEVIIDGVDDEPNTYLGRTRYDAEEIDNCVIIKSDKRLEKGQMVRAKIIDGFDYDLVGELV